MKQSNLQYNKAQKPVAYLLIPAFQLLAEPRRLQPLPIFLKLRQIHDEIFRELIHRCLVLQALQQPGPFLQ